MTTRMIPLGTFRIRKDTPRGWPHDDFQSAEREARKLASQSPGSTFIVMQEVARVTYRAGDAESLKDWGNSLAAANGAREHLSPAAQQRFERRLFGDDA